jgi:hypothetical protein
MYEVVFEQVLKEHFDTRDRRSIRTLLSLNEADQNTNNVWNFVKPISKDAMSKIGNKAAFAIISDYLYTFLAKHKEHANTPIGQALSKLAYGAAKRAK